MTDTTLPKKLVDAAIEGAAAEKYRTRSLVWAGISYGFAIDGVFRGLSWATYASGLVEQPIYDWGNVALTLLIVPVLVLFGRWHRRRGEAAHTRATAAFGKALKEVSHRETVSEEAETEELVLDDFKIVSETDVDDGQPEGASQR